METLHELTRIDKWFLYKLQRIHQTGEKLKELSLGTLQGSTLRDAKKTGFSGVSDSNYI